MFADMPLDNRTVDKFAALAATSGFFKPFETHRDGDDLMFRRG
ncbi:MAG TPA: hypothetical protein VGZ92_05040 [Bradyrhizobium sp.]|jgi:hypothetical protein|nr:hypothetical protein [Bradyrhizobium sp.]